MKYIRHDGETEEFEYYFTLSLCMRNLRNKKKGIFSVEEHDKQFLSIVLLKRERNFYKIYPKRSPRTDICNNKISIFQL